MAENSSDSMRNYFVNQMRQAGLFYEEDLASENISSEYLVKIDQDQAMRFHILPIGEEQSINGEKKLIVVTDNNSTFKHRTRLEEELGQKIKLLYASEDNLRLALLKYYAITSYRQESGQQREVDVDSTPLKGAINEMLQDAARRKASDIHMLPNMHGYQVDFRINGHMVDVSDEHIFTETQIDSVARLIKMMDETGNVDGQSTIMPSEGSFYLRRGKQDIFVRLETMPVGTNGQEKINLRLLPQAGKSNIEKKTLDSIGYTKQDLDEIKRTLYKNATGMFLNSGPTGAGKTTSLHAQIHYVLDSTKENLNVIEIAEPIEIYEEKFTQVQVRRAANEALDLSAEKILIASLRSDPDIILYNEIRNGADATVAMQASNTGHRVFSTVHASDCTKTISRLLDFDISKTTLLSELKMIISQRLVATLCPHCSHEHILTDREKELLSAEEIAACEGRLRERGTKHDIENCPAHCNNGYSGRTALAEYIIFNNKIRDALLVQHSFSEIQDILRKEGFHSMWDKGIALAQKGEIELDELIHVVGRDS